MTPERRRQIDELFNAAKERGPNALAGADPELRREVEGLLSKFRTADVPLDILFPRHDA